MNQDRNLNTIGVAGLGLMGQGIAACLLRGGFRVVGYSRTVARKQETLDHVAGSLGRLESRNIIKPSDMAGWEKRFTYVDSIQKMNDCQFVIETVGESIELKREIYQAIESVVGRAVVIATNTSGISVSRLQKELRYKDRFVGMHWAEPAEITKYLEISPGEDTAPYAIAASRRIGERCRKHPTVLNFDIPGLISNRLMYAMMREAVHLVEMGVADVETIDRSFRNDIGWWATLCGPFRWMDLTGHQIYAKVMEGLFPELSNNVDLPGLMKEKVTGGTKFYAYEAGEENEWENLWTDFTHDLAELVNKYERKAKL